MTCIRIQGGFLCRPHFWGRLRLRDGTCVFVEYHNYLGPSFFRDRNYTREIEDWYDNPSIVEALNWLVGRGLRA